MKTLNASMVAGGIAIVLGLSLAMVLGIPGAAADESQTTARKLRESGEILSLEKIAASARSIKPGEILETELELEHGRYIYEVELLDARGQVWELNLDAKTGKLIKLESED